MRTLQRFSLILGAALLCVALGFVFVHVAEAQTPQLGDLGLSNAQATGLGTQDIRTTVARVIQVALGLVGVVLVVLIIYAGVVWMTAGGNEDRVVQAKKTLSNAIIGLVIMLTAVAITEFVIRNLLQATGGGGGAGSEQQVVGGFANYTSGSLGEGIIRSHYPPPGAIDVSRNAKIIVTFKQAIDPTTIINNGKISDNVRIIPTASVGAGGVGAAPQSAFIADVTAVTNNNLDFVFTPSAYLGSPTERISYTVQLGTGIRKMDKSPAFAGSFASGYKWEFETGTVVDTQPPTVVSMYPRSAGSNLPRNTIVKITFSEPMDPVTTSGKISGFTNVTIATAGVAVNGEWSIGNEYRTVEFRSNEQVGTNSCGAPVFVLPANASLGVTARAARVGTDAPQAALPYPFDGVTDAAGNSLDGNSNGKADGAPTDSVGIAFTTSGSMDTTAPTIVSVTPGIDAPNVEATRPVSFLFSEPLAATSVSNESVLMSAAPSYPIWFYPKAVDVGASDEPVASAKDQVVRTRIDLMHAPLATSTGVCVGGGSRGKQCAVSADCPGSSCSITRFDYYPVVTSGVTDLSQNCFLPACGEDPTRPFCCSGVSCSSACVIGSGGAYRCGG